MPPEVFKGEISIRDVGPEGDVYALGVLAYRLFTGKLPYDLQEDISSLDALTRLTKVHLLGATLTPLNRICPDLPVGLSAAIEAALEADPTRRPKDAAELLKRLKGSAPPQPVSANRQYEDNNSDQTLVVNLPKFGGMEKKAQTEDRKQSHIAKEAPAAPAKKTPLPMIAAVVITALVIGGGAYFLKGGGGGEQKPVGPVTTAVPAPAPAPAAPAAPPPVASEQAKSLEDQAFRAMNNRDYNAAIKAAQQALDLNPKSMDAMKILGASYAAQKNKTEARKWFNQVLQENPSDPNAAEWLKKLR
jgi:tetratricopeptide (TPR) repeat protein